MHPVKRLGAAVTMSETNRPYNEIEDYLATFSLEEQKEYRTAETALDLANLLYHIRYSHGSTQLSAAERKGFKQQAISRLEQAASNIGLGIFQHYLGALGYHLEISVIEDRTGNVAGKTSFSRLR
jgi:hypothetical protein